MIISAMSFHSVSDHDIIHMTDDHQLLRLSRYSGLSFSLNLQVSTRNTNIVCAGNTYIMYDAYAKCFVTQGSNCRTVDVLNKKASSVIKFLMNLMTSTTKFAIDEASRQFILCARSMIWIYNHRQTTLRIYPIVPERFTQHFNLDESFEINVSDDRVAVHQKRNATIVRDILGNYAHLIVFPFNLTIMSVSLTSYIYVMLRDTITGTVRVVQVTGTTPLTTWYEFSAAPVYIYCGYGLCTMVDGEVKGLEMHRVHNSGMPIVTVIE